MTPAPAPPGGEEAKPKPSPQGKSGSLCNRLADIAMEQKKNQTSHKLQPHFGAMTGL
jgi:hypothetical protein